MMTSKMIEKIALANGFKLKEQPDGSMALNPYVFEFANALLASKQSEIDALKEANFMITNERDNSRNSAQYLINEKRALTAKVA